MKKGKEFEILVESIYRQLDNNSIITRNDKIQGYNSGLMREIDLSIRNRVGNHEILVIIQAKDYLKTKVDVNTLGEFKAVIDDVRASKGVLVTKKGFTKGAIIYARNLNIDILIAHDSENKTMLKTFPFPHSVKHVSRKNCDINIELDVEDEIYDSKDLERKIANISFEDNIFNKNGEDCNLWDILKEYHNKFSLPQNEGRHKLCFNCFKVSLNHNNISYPIKNFYLTVDNEVNYYGKILISGKSRGFIDAKNNSPYGFSILSFETTLNFTDKNSGWFKCAPINSEKEVMAFQVVDGWTFRINSAFTPY